MRPASPGGTTAPRDPRGNALTRSGPADDSSSRVAGGVRAVDDTDDGLSTRTSNRCAGCLRRGAAAWLPRPRRPSAPQQVEALDRQGATAIIVRREPGLTAAERADVRADADVTLERRSTLADTEVVRADKGDLAEAVAELNRDPDVVYAEPVVVQSALSADPYWSSLWGLESASDMDVPEAWGPRSGTGVTVGVVDTGLAAHPSRPRQPARLQRRRGRRRQARQRHRRRRQRLRRRLERLRLRRRVPEHQRLRGRQHAGSRQRPAGRPRPRHARRRHDRRPARQQPGHRRRRARREDHAAARARHQRLRDQHRDRRGVRLRGPDGPADRQRQPRRRRARPDAALGDPGVPQHALRGRRRQQQRQQRRDAARSLRAARRQHPLRRRVRRERPARVVLQLRREQRRRVRARHLDPLDVPQPRTCTCRAPRWRARTRPASRHSCCRSSPARARSTSRARSWRPPRRSPTWPARP